MSIMRGRLIPHGLVVHVHEGIYLLAMHDCRQARKSLQFPYSASA
jgi:hypothetical protein